MNRDVRTRTLITVLLVSAVSIVVSVIVFELVIVPARNKTRLVAECTSAPGTISSIQPASSREEDGWVVGDLEAVGEKTALACGSNCTIRKTTDGSNWTDVLSSGGSSLHDISATKDGTVWAVGSGIIVRSVDEGKTWRRVTIGGFETEGAFLGIEAIDEKNIWIRCGAGRVIRTEDGGKNWRAYTINQKDEDKEEEPDQSHTSIVSFKPCENNVCWAAIDRGGDEDIFMYRTMDGGRTWEPTSSRSFFRVECIDAVGPDEAFVMGLRQKEGVSSEPRPPENALVATFDGGKTWSEPWLEDVRGIDLVDRDTLWAVVPGSPQSRVVLATQAGRHWSSSLIDIRSSETRRGNSLMRTPIVSGASGSCAWVCGGSSSWWATARTTDGGSNWTYYEE